MYEEDEMDDGMATDAVTDYGSTFEADSDYSSEGDKELDAIWSAPDFVAALRNEATPQVRLQMPYPQHVSCSAPEVRRPPKYSGHYREEHSPGISQAFDQHKSHSAHP